MFDAELLAGPRVRGHVSRFGIVVGAGRVMVTGETSVALTARDLDVLEMVHSYQGCTSEQIHARFWRRNSSLSACYRRLALLVDADFLTAHRLPSLTGVGSGKRFLSLGSRGRACLAQRHGLQAAEYRAREVMTPLFADHHFAIGDFHLALELAAASSNGVTLLSWQPEEDLKRTPLRVNDAGGHAGKAETITLVPDGAFTLEYAGRRQRCFLEMDMGTIAPRRLRKKVRGYLLHENASTTPVFFVVPTESRERLLAQTIRTEAESLSRTASIFFLASRQRVTEDTVLFLPIWHQVGVPHRQAIVRAADRSARLDVAQ